MALHVKPGTTWDEVYTGCVAAAPEAFDEDRLRNLVEGAWSRVGVPGVGGELLVQAVTEATDGAELYGNFPGSSRTPVGSGAGVA